MIELNNMKLYNDDCLNILEKLKSENIQVDSIIVDLPYFRVVKDEFDNQWNSKEEYLNWVFTVFTIASYLIKNDGNIIVFCSRQYARYISNIFEDKMLWTEKRQIIWARKRGFNNTRGHALASGYEPILYWCNGNNGTFNNIKIKPDTKRPEYVSGILKDGISLSDVWSDIPALPHNSKEKVAHPTQKPIKLMERIVEMFTNEGDTILDFCMGSGSTGVACMNLNRNFIGIEKDENYFKIALERLKNYDNKKNIIDNMTTKYKEGDIIIYPLPGVCIGQCYENIVPKEARILKVYDGICEDGVIVDFELLDNSIMGKITGKLLNEKNYLI